MSLPESNIPDESSKQPDNTKLWMIPYADLMSTLVILFMALYGYAVMGKTSAYEQAIAQIQMDMATTDDEAKRFELKQKEAQLAAQLEKDMQEELSKDSFGLQITSERIKVTMASPVLFTSGSATLKPQIKALLRKFSGSLKDMPNDVMLEGHTDSIPVTKGRFKTNWELSAGRAFSVIEFFIQRELDPSRFFAYGYGEHRPVASNETREGRAKNRRIEISLIRKSE